MSQKNTDLRHMLRDLGRALSAAIAESPEVGESLRRIREEGYQLQLTLDCRRDEGSQERVGVPAPVPPKRRGGPSFQVDASDVAFLRSLGIDPTRRLRRRRSPNSPR